MPISEARKKANDKWSKKAYESIAFRVRKGTRENWRAAADQAGISLSSYIQAAADQAGISLSSYI